MGTVAPSVNHIGINSTVQTSAQQNRLASANSCGGSSDVKIGADGGNGEGGRTSHTTVGALGDHGVGAGSCSESGVSGKSGTVPRIGSSTRHDSGDSAGGIVADDGVTNNSKTGGNSFNGKVDGVALGLTRIFGITYNNTYSVATDSLHICIEGITGSGCQGTVKIPSIGRGKCSGCIGIRHSESDRACANDSVNRLKSNVSQCNAVGLEGDGITFKVITRVIKINRQGNIFVTISRVSNIISIGKGCCNQGTALIPFPFEGLDRARAVCLSSQSDRRRAGAELRSSNSSNGSSIYIEIMYRGVSVITSGIRDLTIEFVNKSVGQGRKGVNRKGISGVRSAKDVLAITSPLILHFHIIRCGGLSGEGDDVMFTCTLGTNNVNRNVRSDGQHYRVGSHSGRLAGCNNTVDEVRPHRIA